MVVLQKEGEVKGEKKDPQLVRAGQGWMKTGERSATTFAHALKTSFITFRTRFPFLAISSMGSHELDEQDGR